MITLRFVKTFGLYNKGEVAGFAEDEANRLIHQRRVAVLESEYQAAQAARAEAEAAAKAEAEAAAKGKPATAGRGKTAK